MLCAAPFLLALWQLSATSQSIGVRRTLSIPRVQTSRSSTPKMGNKQGKTKKPRASAGRIATKADNGPGNLVGQVIF